MSEPTVRGVVHVIEPTKVVGQRGFRKRLVVLQQDSGRFTNYIPVEFINEQCDRVDELQVGDEAEITYRLTGRKWQRDAQSEVKYFVSVEAIDFRVLRAATQGGSPDPSVEEEVFDEEPPF